MTPWAGCAPTTPLTPKQSEKVAAAHRATIAEALDFSALTDPPADWAALVHEWTTSVLAPAFAELEAFYAEQVAA